MKKATDEQIIEAYEETGSVWAAGDLLGMVGQSVHERLRKLEYPLNGRKWTPEEYKQLEQLAGTMTIREIARILGRSYGGVAIKLSRSGLNGRMPRESHKRRMPRGSGYTKARVSGWIKELRVYSGSLRQFCIERGITVDGLAYGIQKYQPEFWTALSKTKQIDPKTCPYCGTSFYPMNGKQKTCSRKCSIDQQNDLRYFGGKRRRAVGLAEGICQLCEQPKSKGLSAHHIFGKENDPDNEYLIALCQGCHQIVGQLAGRKFVEAPDGWENLISLVYARRVADRRLVAGLYITVEIEEQSEDDIEQWLEEQAG